MSFVVVVHFHFNFLANKFVIINPQQFAVRAFIDYNDVVQNVEQDSGFVKIGQSVYSKTKRNVMSVV